MMMISSQEILRAITHTLENNVLPELDAASWPASNIRSCVLLLHYLEGRTAVERQVLLNANGLIEAFLNNVQQGAFGPVELSQAGHSSIAAAREATNLESTEMDVDALWEAHEKGKRALETVGEALAAEPAVEATALRTAFHECLFALNAHERRLMATAGDGVPL
jgi:hypothetical protein